MILMPLGVVKELIFKLSVLISDDMPVAFFGFDDAGLSGAPPYSANAQHVSVDMIYRCLKSGLIAIFPEDWLERAGIHSVEAFAADLARVDQNKKTTPDTPESRQHALDMAVWLDPLIYCTDAGAALVSRYFQNALDLEDEARVLGFNEEACKIFASHGVSWSEGDNGFFGPKGDGGN